MISIALNFQEPEAFVLASLRNLANGIYELRKERNATTADSLRSWCQQQTFTTVWPLLHC